MENKTEIGINNLLATAKKSLIESVLFLKTRFAILFVLILIIPLIPFALTYVTTRVIDELIFITDSGSEEISDKLWSFILLFLALNILSRVLETLQSYFAKDMFYRLGEYFTLRYLKKSSELDLYHYEDPKQNDLIRKASESYSWRPQQFVNRIMWILPDLLRIFVSISIIAFFSPLFFFVISLSTVPALIASIKTSKGVWSIWDSKTEARRIYSSAAGTLSSEHALMELRIFRTKDYVFDIVKDLFNDFFSAERKANLRKTFIESATTIFAVIGIFSFWLFTISKVIEGEITVGLLTFYASASMSYSTALAAFFRNVSQSYDDSLYMYDYYRFMELENVIKYGDKKLHKKPIAPRIEFKNVSFKYPGSEKYVLTNINLSIEPGEKIALVGENGAGKTTLIKLLTRFYDVTEGQILIDGNDIKDLQIDDWYSQLGVLFQDFQGYSYLPVKRSIGIGDIDKIENIEDIKKAASKSGADKFIEQFEYGYEQRLSKHFEKGTDLSGGQWQRVALARAFFRDAPVLILDEPTSAIDAKGEYEIFQKLYEFTTGKSVIIISHRFSTVRQADKIFVIDEGQMIEEGSHKELLELNGKYAAAFRTQAQGYK